MSDDGASSVSVGWAIDEWAERSTAFVLLLLSLLQLRAETPLCGRLKRSFHRVLPVGFALLAAQSVDPFSLRGVYSRRALLLLERNATILLMALTALWVHLSVAAQYASLGVGDRAPASLRVLLAALVTFAFVVSNTLALVTEGDAAEGWYLLAMALVALLLAALVCVAVQLLLRTAGVGRSGAAALVRRRGRIIQVVASAMALALAGLLAYAAVPLLRGEDSPVAHSDDLDRSTYDPRSSALFWLKTLMMASALRLTWIPLRCGGGGDGAAASSSAATVRRRSDVDFGTSAAGSYYALSGEPPDRTATNTSAAAISSYTSDRVPSTAGSGSWDPSPYGANDDSVLDRMWE